MNEGRFSFRFRCNDHSAAKVEVMSLHPLAEYDSIHYFPGLRCAVPQFSKGHSFRLPRMSTLQFTSGRSSQGYVIRIVHRTVLISALGLYVCMPSVCLLYTSLCGSPDLFPGVTQLSTIHWYRRSASVCIITISIITISIIETIWKTHVVIPEWAAQ